MYPIGSGRSYVHELSAASIKMLKYNTPAIWAVCKILLLISLAELNVVIVTDGIEWTTYKVAC